MSLKKTDPQTYNLLKLEKKRQNENLTLIPSENHASPAVLAALGSVFNNKYSEGEPGKRYYQGNQIIDDLELLVNQRALALFGLKKEKWHVNVKAISAAIANFAVITALLEPGQKIMAMNLPDGGHLSHGWDLPDGRKVSFSSKIFKVVRYTVEKQTGIFDYQKILTQAQREKPRILISGGTAYPREINHQKMANIAQQVRAYYLADVAHEAGLIAGKSNCSPFPYADVVTMSTQKTLRGPRGSIIICKKDVRKIDTKIDRAIFPGLQGGPFNHSIAAIGVALKEASHIRFKKYANQTVKNAKLLAQELKKYGFHLSSGGTDKHLILIDLRYTKHPDPQFNGQLDATILAEKFEQAGIVLNKNTVPFETGSPFKPSGLRLGTPAITTRGMREKEIRLIATWIKQIIFDQKSPKDIKKEVKKLCLKFPI